MILSSVKPGFADTLLIQAPRYYGQFALPMRKESLCIDIVSRKLRLIIHASIRTLSMVPSVSVLMGFDCIYDK